jgi:membrane-anchored glycerophosphoryl diester phosphodiesterase (GDPDase)
MKAMIWRVVYATICFVLFWWIAPLFLDVIGVAVSGNVLQLLKICSAAIAILYVIFGKEPPYPF